MSKAAVILTPPVGVTLPANGFQSDGEWQNGQVTCFVPTTPDPGEQSFTLTVTIPAQTPPVNGTPVVVKSVESNLVVYCTWDTTELPVQT